MSRYPALLDGSEGAYGVVFPDLPGCLAMGQTVDDALLNAEDALRDYVTEMLKAGRNVQEPSALETIETPAGTRLVLVPLVRPSGKNVRRLNLVLDEEVARFIDDEARRRGMTRKAYVTWMTQRMASMSLWKTP